MPIYTNINRNSKSISNLYDNINAAKKTNSAVYANINNSSKKIFPVEQTVYTWNRYVSYISDTTSETVYTEPRYFDPTSSVEKIPGSSWFSKSSNKYTITAYSGYSFSTSTGLYTLSGPKSFTYTYYSRYSDCEWNPSDAEAQMEKTYMYLPSTSSGNSASGSKSLYMINSFHTPDAADSSHYFSKKVKSRTSSTTYTYTYSFKYDGTVTSTNPYAYSTAGNTSSYTSSSDNDIRTVYVRA